MAGLLLLSSGAEAASKPLPMDKIDFGPEPDWSRFHAIAEEGIKARLVDPDSAKFTWPWAPQKGGFKPILEPWVYGYYTCGTVNSRNRMGGYNGSRTFIVAVKYDRVIYVDFGGDNGFGLVDDTCKKALQQGVFAPAPSLSAGPSAALTGPTLTKYGFTVMAVPDGAYVMSTDSVTERAGLKAGMVISNFNGIELKGLGGAVISQLFGGATAAATLTVIGRDLPVKLEETTGGPASLPGGSR